MIIFLFIQEQKKKGVIAASAGNHALALSYHGSDLGIPVTVVMPMIAPLMKIQNCKTHGATVIMKGSNINEVGFPFCKLLNGYMLSFFPMFWKPYLLSLSFVLKCAPSMIKSNQFVCFFVVFFCKHIVLMKETWLKPWNTYSWLSLSQIPRDLPISLSYQKYKLSKLWCHEDWNGFCCHKFSLSMSWSVIWTCYMFFLLSQKVVFKKFLTFFTVLGWRILHTSI